MKKLALSLLMCLPLGALCDGLPDLGDVSQVALSPLEERQIGQQSMMEIRASKQYLDDAEVNDYLNLLGRKLVQNSAEPGLGFEFFAIDDTSVNAFAMPGGFIGVNSGLLLTVQSESELAAVLSHEIAHVTQHHLARMIASQQGEGLATMAALAVAILAARTNPQVTEATIASVQARSIQKQLDYTRSNEQEADRIGLDILQRSEFNIHAMPEFLERLQKATRLMENNAPNYLRTHPITSERVADIENRVQKQPYRLIPDSLEFQLVRTKLIAAQKSALDAVTYFTDALNTQKHGNPISQQYGLVGAQLRIGNIKQAALEMANLKKLLKGYPDSAYSPMIVTLAGEVKHAEGNPDATLEFYRNAVLDFPQHRTLIYVYTELLIQNRQEENAVKLLTEQILRHPDDTTLYDLQARAFSGQGKLLEQHQAQAYSYAWQGNLVAALQQLELAKKSGGNFYQLSALESDIREIKEMLDVSKSK